VAPRCTESEEEPDTVKYRTALFFAANAVSVESDCTGPCGKVARPTTSIDTVITERLQFEPEPVDSEVFDHPGIVVAGDRRL
jgi:hypothetical protein